MLLIQKSKPPAELIEYAQQGNAYFDGMDPETKKALRASLLDEQGYLCAYCMARLSSDGTDVKIEHYRARNKENELEYNNLLAVCKGGEGESHARQTCDTHKGNEELHINPQKQADIAKLEYTSDGHIKSSDIAFQRDLDVVLNLNDEKGRLVGNRRSALMAFKKAVARKLRGKTAAKGFWQRYDDFYSRKHSGMYSPYAGILLWYIKKKIRQSSK